MQIPHRTLRAKADTINRYTRNLSPQQAEYRANILKVATAIFAEVGPAHVSFGGLAHALVISTTVLRKYFSDISTVLHTILHDHLRRLQAETHALANQPAAARRRRYLEQTRYVGGVYTDIHRLLIEHRTALPDDLLTDLHDARATLAAQLGLPNVTLLDFIDTQYVNYANLERLLLIVQGLPEEAPAAEASQAAHPAQTPAQPPESLMPAHQIRRADLAISFLAPSVDAPSGHAPSGHTQWPAVVEPEIPLPGEIPPYPATGHYAGMRTPDRRDVLPFKLHVLSSTAKTVPVREREELWYESLAKCPGPTRN